MLTINITGHANQLTLGTKPLCIEPLSFGEEYIGEVGKITTLIAKIKERHKGLVSEYIHNVQGSLDVSTITAKPTVLLNNVSDHWTKVLMAELNKYDIEYRFINL